MNFQMIFIKKFILKNEFVRRTIVINEKENRLTDLCKIKKSDFHRRKACCI